MHGLSAQRACGYTYRKYLDQCDARLYLDAALGTFPRQNVGAISQDLVMFESEGMHWGRALSSGSC